MGSVNSERAGLKLEAEGSLLRRKYHDRRRSEDLASIHVIRIVYQLRSGKCLDRVKRTIRGRISAPHWFVVKRLVNGTPREHWLTNLVAVEHWRSMLSRC